MPITVGPYFRDMLILVKMENRGIRKKTLETKERSITGTHLTVVIRAVINKRLCAKLLSVILFSDPQETVWERSSYINNLFVTNYTMHYR